MHHLMKAAAHPGQRRGGRADGGQDGAQDRGALRQQRLARQLHQLAEPAQRGQPRVLVAAARLAHRNQRHRAQVHLPRPLDLQQKLLRRQQDCFSVKACSSMFSPAES